MDDGTRAGTATAVRPPRQGPRLQGPRLQGPDAAQAERRAVRRALAVLVASAVWAVAGIAFAVVATRLEPAGPVVTVAGAPGATGETTASPDPSGAASPGADPDGVPKAGQDADGGSGGGASGGEEPAGPPTSGTRTGTVTVVVPDVRGLSRDEAGRVLATAGLRWDPHLVVTTGGEKVGRVTGQRPAAGVTVPADTVVKIRVAGGPDGSGVPAPDPTPSPTPTGDPPPVDGASPAPSGEASPAATAAAAPAGGGVPAG